MTDQKTDKTEAAQPMDAPQGADRIKTNPSPLDKWMAMHQRACWAIFAGTAGAGAAAILWLTPKSVGAYAAFGFAVALMLGYRWCADAPKRVLRAVGKRLRIPPDGKRDAESLALMDSMEKRLPSMQKKELAFPCTVYRSALLARLRRREEALTLLRAFDRIWDASQREQIDELIRLISGSDDPKENE